MASLTLILGKLTQHWHRYLQGAHFRLLMFWHHTILLRGEHFRCRHYLHLAQYSHSVSYPWAICFDDLCCVAANELGSETREAENIRLIWCLGFVQLKGEILSAIAGPSGTPRHEIRTISPRQEKWTWTGKPGTIYENQQWSNVDFLPGDFELKYVSECIHNARIVLMMRKVGKPHLKSRMHMAVVLHDKLNLLLKEQEQLKALWARRLFKIYACGFRFCFWRVLLRGFTWPWGPRPFSHSNGFAWRWTIFRKPHTAYTNNHVMTIT